MNFNSSTLQPKEVKVISYISLKLIGNEKWKSSKLERKLKNTESLLRNYKILRHVASELTNYGK